MPIKVMADDEVAQMLAQENQHGTDSDYDGPAGSSFEDMKKVAIELIKYNIYVMEILPWVEGLCKEYNATEKLIYRKGGLAQ